MNNNDPRSGGGMHHPNAPFDNNNIYNFNDNNKNNNNNGSKTITMIT